MDASSPRAHCSSRRERASAKPLVSRSTTLDTRPSAFRTQSPGSSTKPAWTSSWRDRSPHNSSSAKNSCRESDSTPAEAVSVCTVDFPMSPADGRALSVRDADVGLSAAPGGNGLPGGRAPVGSERRSGGSCTIGGSTGPRPIVDELRCSGVEFDPTNDGNRRGDMRAEHGDASADSSVELSSASSPSARRHRAPTTRRPRPDPRPLPARCRRRSSRAAIRSP